MNKEKIILDLCGGTGAWSQPYKDAGYDVRVISLPEWSVSQSTFRYDEGVLEFWRGKQYQYVEIEKIYGILAAPPCTMFSMARSNAKTPRDLFAGIRTVRECLDIIWGSQLKGKRLQFWAIENPKGRLRWFLGKPAFTFDPSEFGGDYNKTTDLWGYFKEPKLKAEYKRFASTDKNTRKLPKIPAEYVKDKNMSDTAIRRSITNSLFAEAFFKANK